MNTNTQAKMWGYARCSTNIDKQDITRQTRELENIGIPEVQIYKEYVSGSSNNKVELDKLLSIVKEGDTIVTTEVSRLSRSTKQLIELIEFIRDHKLKLVILNSITIDCTNGTIDPMTKAFLQMMGIFAELERDIISERVKSGVENARSQGKTLGRPKTEPKLSNEFLHAYNLYKQGSIKKKDVQFMSKLSKPTTLKYIKYMEDKEEKESQQQDQIQ